MRVSTMIRINAATATDAGLMQRITNFARQVEARGFPGIWIGDSMGRGRPTLDSLQVLTAVAAVTSKVELGISVLQLPLRNPVELTHRVQSPQVMSNNRLILGVESGWIRRPFSNGRPTRLSLILWARPTCSPGVLSLARIIVPRSRSMANQSRFRFCRRSISAGRLQ